MGSFNEIRLKGTEVKNSQGKVVQNEQKLDLSKLQNLKQTEANKSIFLKYDKDGDGSISQDEAVRMAQDLQKAAGNGKLSQRELNKQFGTKGQEGKNLFNALRMLAYQQSTGLGDSGVQIDKKNNTTITQDPTLGEVTRFYNQNGTLSRIQAKKGDVTTTYLNDKAIEKNQPSEEYNDKTKKTTKYDYDQNTRTEIYTNKDKNGNISYEDTYQPITSNEVSGRKVTVYNNSNQKENIFEYKQMMINGNNKLVYFKSISDPDDPAKKEISEYKYDSNGKIKESVTIKGQTKTRELRDNNGNIYKIIKETGNDALDTTTEFETKNGIRTGIEKNKLGKPLGVSITEQSTTLTKMSIDIKKGDTFDNVIDKFIEKYNLPKEDSFIRSRVKKALVKENFKSDNTGLCRQMKSGKYKGNYYFVTGKTAELTIDGLNKILKQNADGSMPARIGAPNQDGPGAKKIEPINVNTDPKIVESSLKKMDNKQLEHLGNTSNDREVLTQLVHELNDRGNIAHQKGDRALANKFESQITNIVKRMQNLPTNTVSQANQTPASQAAAQSAQPAANQTPASQAAQSTQPAAQASPTAKQYKLEDDPVYKDLQQKTRRNFISYPNTLNRYVDAMNSWQDGTVINHTGVNDKNANKTEFNVKYTRVTLEDGTRAFKASDGQFYAVDYSGNPNLDKKIIVPQTPPNPISTG